MVNSSSYCECDVDNMYVICVDGCHLKAQLSSLDEPLSGFQSWNNNGFNIGHTWVYPQCLLSMSAGLMDPGMKLKATICDAIAALTRWKDSKQ